MNPSDHLSPLSHPRSNAPSIPPLPARVRPLVTGVLAMSVDGKIADYRRSAARFGSECDRAHLERAIAQADGVLLGAGTLRAYGSSLALTTGTFIEQRRHQGRPPQPVQMVCSASGHLDRSWRFFRQPFPRWLLTTPEGAGFWQEGEAFERVLAIVPSGKHGCEFWPLVFDRLFHLGIQTLTVLGGGTLVASLLEADLVDELKITICPLVLGGETAPTLVDGKGFSALTAPHFTLLATQVVQDEVFLHYRKIRG